MVHDIDLLDRLSTWLANLHLLLRAYKRSIMSNINALGVKRCETDQKQQLMTAVHLTKKFDIMLRPRSFEYKIKLIANLTEG